MQPLRPHSSRNGLQASAQSAAPPPEPLQRVSGAARRALHPSPEAEEVPAAKRNRKTTWSTPIYDLLKIEHVTKEQILNLISNLPVGRGIGSECFEVAGALLKLYGFEEKGISTSVILAKQDPEAILPLLRWVLQNASGQPLSKAQTLLDFLETKLNWSPEILRQIVSLFVGPREKIKLSPALRDLLLSEKGSLNNPFLTERLALEVPRYLTWAIEGILYPELTEERALFRLIVQTENPTRLSCMNWIINKCNNKKWNTYYQQLQLQMQNADTIQDKKVALQWFLCDRQIQGTNTYLLHIIQLLTELADYYPKWIFELISALSFEQSDLTFDHILQRCAAHPTFLWEPLFSQDWIPDWITYQQKDINRPKGALIVAAHAHKDEVRLSALQSFCDYFHAQQIEVTPWQFKMITLALRKLSGTENIVKAYTLLLHFEEFRTLWENVKTVELNSTDSLRKLYQAIALRWPQCPAFHDGLIKTLFADDIMMQLYYTPQTYKAIVKANLEWGLYFPSRFRRFEKQTKLDCIKWLLQNLQRVPFEQSFDYFHRILNAMWFFAIDFAPLKEIFFARLKTINLDVKWPNTRNRSHDIHRTIVLLGQLANTSPNLFKDTTIDLLFPPITNRSISINCLEALVTLARAGARVNTFDWKRGIEPPPYRVEENLRLKVAVNTLQEKGVIVAKPSPSPSIVSLLFNRQIRGRFAP